VIPAFSYQIVCRKLAHAFKTRYRQSAPEQGVRLVGLLFSRPTSPLAKEEIIPNLDYFHHRSGNHVDFFCAGYGQYWQGRRDEFPDQTRVGPGQHSDWLFSAMKFNDFRGEIERMTRWRYSGAVDLILANGRYDAEQDEGHIDFSSAISCQLDKMKREGAITSVEAFFEEIFRFSETTRGRDPTWGFSDKKGIAIAGSALKRLILELLPRKIGDDLRRLEHLAVRDVSFSA